MTTHTVTRTVLTLALAAGITGTQTFAPHDATSAPEHGAITKQGPVRPQVEKKTLQQENPLPLTAQPATGWVESATAPKDKQGHTLTREAKLDPQRKAGKRDDLVISLPAKHADLVGLSWDQRDQAPSTSTVAVRARNAQGWQEWQELSIEPIYDAQGKIERYATEPLWVNNASVVQVRATRTNRALLKAAKLTTIVSPSTPADASLSPHAPQAGSAQAAYKPSIISRAGWGADESLRKGCNPSIKETSKVVVVHHTAGTNSYTAAQSASIVRAIYAYDTQTKGWCDIAYNMIVDKYGQKFEGRYGGLDKQVKAAHADSFNNYTFGISILGNYDKVSVPSAGFRALQEGVAMRLSQFYIKPWGTTNLTSEYTGTTSKYPVGTTYKAKNVAAHRESSNTACPGRYLYPRMEELTRGAASLAGWNGSTFSSPIYKSYQATGGASKWGPVTWGENTVATGLQRTRFTSNVTFYNGSGGVRRVGPGLDRAWWSHGGPDKLGHPSSDEISAPAGWYFNTAKNKTITYSRKGNITSFTEGGIRNYWVSRGGMSGSLGAPVAAMGSKPGEWFQRFEGGVIHFTTTGRAYVTAS